MPIIIYTLLFCLEQLVMTIVTFKFDFERDLYLAPKFMNWVDKRLDIHNPNSDNYPGRYYI